MSDAAALEREFERIERELMGAVQRRDRAWLENALAPEFTLTTGRPGAEVRGRSEWLDVTEREYAIDHFAFEALAVQDYGDVVVVRSRYRQRGRMGAEDRTAAYRMTDVWVRRDARWQLAARHATALPESA